MKKTLLLWIVAAGMVTSVVGCGGPGGADKPSPPEASPEVLASRDTAVTYVREHYDEAPGESLAWMEERVTPAGIVGAETYQYTAGDWVITISYPVVLPEQTVYEVSVVNQGTGLEWEGKVDARGAVTENPNTDLVYGEASVESIDILILESFPVQVNVVAKGHLPDACTRIDQVEQAMEGNTFSVTISTVRPAGEVCVQMATAFEEMISLEVVGSPAGSYIVDVNGVTGSFDLETDNVLPEEQGS